MKKKSKNTGKKIPKFKSDSEAAAFLEQDLSDLDFSQFKKVSFELHPKTCKVNMRFPEPLLEAVKRKAERKGISYQKYIRHVLEQSLR